MDSDWKLDPKIVRLGDRSRFERVKHLAPRLFDEVLPVPWGRVCFVSNVAEVGDFIFDSNHEEFYARFEACYGLDARVIGSTYIVDILEYLQSQGVQA